MVTAAIGMLCNSSCSLRWGTNSTTTFQYGSVNTEALRTPLTSTPISKTSMRYSPHTTSPQCCGTMTKATLVFAFLDSNGERKSFAHRIPFRPHGIGRLGSAAHYRRLSMCCRQTGIRTVSRRRLLLRSHAIGRSRSAGTNRGFRHFSVPDRRRSRTRVFVFVMTALMLPPAAARSDALESVGQDERRGRNLQHAVVSSDA